MAEKRAILAVSFGTSHTDTCAKTIEVIEHEIQENYLQCPLYRAWTSEVIRRKVEARDGVPIFSVKEALEQMCADGFTEIIVQPTFVIDGVESEKMLEELKRFENSGRCSIAAGTSLLATHEDAVRVIDVLLEEWQLQQGEFLLMMGHGSLSEANAVYEDLNQILDQRGCRNIRICTLHDFHAANWQLLEYSEGLGDSCISRQEYPRKIILAPFMLVSGSHAVHNMAGDQADSWKRRLQKAGFEVECVMKGLGEYVGIRAIIGEHLKAVIAKNVNDIFVDK